MKLSEISTERAVDVLCELTPYISNIVTDEDLVAEIRKSIDPKNAANRLELYAMGVEKINKLIPIVFKARKEDVFGIIGVLNEKSPEEISRQNFLVTANQIREIVKDKDLIGFFKSCAEVEGRE